MFDATFVIGIVSGILTTLSFLPQVMKTHKSKHTKDLSLGMLILFVSGVSLWTVYGFMIGAAPIIIANVVTLALVIYILIMKLRYG